MVAQVLLALGIILVVLVVLAGRARIRRTDDREYALGLIHEEIDAHVEALAAGYVEARSGRCGSRPGADRFAEEIELFIADVLWRRAERSESWLRDALRELLVLERDAVYAEVRQRVEAYLGAPALADQARPPGAKARV